MALLQMGCSYKHYIMSLNDSKHNTLKMKMGEREQDTHTLAASTLKQASTRGEHQLTLAARYFNMASDQEVWHKVIFICFCFPQSILSAPHCFMAVHYNYRKNHKSEYMTLLCVFVVNNSFTLDYARHYKLLKASL